MAAVQSQNTSPEKALRRALFGAGLRFRPQAKNLPCRPDVIFLSQRLAIFVLGCFGISTTAAPKQESQNRGPIFGLKNFDETAFGIFRDLCSLHQISWTPVIAWECEIADPARLLEIVTETTEFLQSCKRSHHTAR